MQIRYNLSHLEQWTRDMRLHEAGVTDTLAPIIQAAQILQARKTDDDVNSICDMCDKLTVSQVSGAARGLAPLAARCSFLTGLFSPDYQDPESVHAGG